jgi:hypothetical protein
LARMPSCCARRDPAAPPSARAICSNDALSRQVRRAYRCTVFGSRSVNICCPQSPVPQKNRRTRNSIRTGIPSQGRSVRRRLYRLCNRRDRRPHEGQRLSSPAGRNTVTNRLHPSTFSSPSSTSPASGTNVRCPIGFTGDPRAASILAPTGSPGEYHQMRRRTTFTPPQNAAFAAFCGLFLLRRSHS